MSAKVHDHIVVFAGPSLPPADRSSDPRLLWRAPAIAGDMLGLIEHRVASVVLIDGRFDESPAIRHKEILGLLANGVPVFGAASMGALRAAELNLFGMVGIGRIYRAFADGRLVGDDEVAVLHAPAELAWTALTEALVDVRATVHAAIRTRIVSIPVAGRLIAAARGLFYKDRTWASLLAAARDDAPDDDAHFARFEVWLARGRVELKRLDALAGVRAALDAQARPRSPQPPPPATLFTAELARLTALDQPG